MNNDELRFKIYERLGLELGSLLSEGGNDWILAEKEVLEEYRQQEFEKLKNIKNTDYLSIDKNSQEFQTVLNSNSILTECFKIIISQRSDLSEEDLLKLIKNGNKDILISLVKTQKLNSTMIDLIIPKSIYLIKKYLFEYQNLSTEQKESLKKLMLSSSLNYKELLEKI